MPNSTQPKAAERYTFIVYRSQPNALNQELKSILFATDDPTIAYGERDRLNEERTPKERYTDNISYRLEKIPMLSRRKSRHPFMRGQGQRDLFNPEDFEKNGNVDHDVPKARGRIHHNSYVNQH